MVFLLNLCFGHGLAVTEQKGRKPDRSEGQGTRETRSNRPRDEMDVRPQWRQEQETQQPERVQTRRRKGCKATVAPRPPCKGEPRRPKGHTPKWMQGHRGAKSKKSRSPTSPRDPKARWAKTYKARGAKDPTTTRPKGCKATGAPRARSAEAPGAQEVQRPGGQRDVRSQGRQDGPKTKVKKPKSEMTFATIMGQLLPPHMAAAAKEPCCKRDLQIQAPRLRFHHNVATSPAKPQSQRIRVCTCMSMAARLRICARSWRHAQTHTRNACRCLGGCSRGWRWPSPLGIALVISHYEPLGR